MVPMSTQTVAEVYLLRADEVIKRGTNTFFGHWRFSSVAVARRVPLTPGERTCRGQHDRLRPREDQPIFESFLPTGP